MSFDMVDPPEDEDEGYEPEHPRDRSADVEEAALNPLSMLGSYFRAPPAEGEEEDREGLIVGNPWSGPGSPFAIYVIEIFGRHGATGYQQLADLEQMMVEKWSFYDTNDWLTMSGEPEGVPAKKPTEFPKEKPQRRRKV